MSSTLEFNVFSSPGKPIHGERPLSLGEAMSWDPMTATLIYGNREAILVDTLTTVREAESLASWIKLHNRQLTTIYITHGHLDHFGGLSVLRHHFPEVQAIATPGTVEFARTQSPDAYRSMFPGQMPTSIDYPEAYADGSIWLEGHELKIFKQGRTDSPDSTSLYVPDLDLVVAGDVVYNKCHQFVAQTTPESRANWISALDALSALEPTTVVAGHKKPGASDHPECIEETKNYLIDFGRLQDSGTTKRELFESMVDLYPDHAGRQSWLLFGLA